MNAAAMISETIIRYPWIPILEIYQGYLLQSMVSDESTRGMTPSINDSGALIGFTPGSDPESPDNTAIYNITPGNRPVIVGDGVAANFTSGPRSFIPIQHIERTRNGEIDCVLSYILDGGVQRYRNLHSSWKNLLHRFVTTYNIDDDTYIRLVRAHHVFNCHSMFFEEDRGYVMERIKEGIEYHLENFNMAKHLIRRFYSEILNRRNEPQMNAD